MSYPAAGGFPQLSGTFIPEIWSGRLLVQFYPATVFAAISNTDYEGEISDHGDTVNIRTTPEITIRDYSKGQTLVAETPEAANVQLLIDQGHYWNFVCDDVDKKQADIAYVDDWAQDAGMRLKIKVDTNILSSIYSDVHASNAGATAGVNSGNINLGVTGTPLGLTETNVIKKIIKCGQCLDEQNAPEMDRFIVLPPWACSLIKSSDLKDASLTGDGQSIMRNGRLGRIDNFTIYRSNNLTDTSDGGNNVANIVFGQKTALTFAAQITENETIRSEDTFGNKIRGLMVYGYEVIKTEALGHLYAYEA